MRTLSAFVLALCFGGGCVPGGCVSQHADFISFWAGSLCWWWVCVSIWTSSAFGLAVCVLVVYVLVSNADFVILRAGSLCVSGVCVSQHVDLVSLRVGSLCWQWV